MGAFYVLCNQEYRIILTKAARESSFKFPCGQKIICCERQYANLMVRVLTLETETGDDDDFPDDNYSTV